jgi:RNA polymerase subunit RPABC4/transcription elongation factor Spt4
LLQAILNLIYPVRCPVCGGIVIPKSEKICPACKEKLPYIHEPRCKKCSKPIEQEEQEYCSDCGRKNYHFDKGYAVWIYNEEMKHLNSRVTEINYELIRYERRLIEIENANVRFSEYRKMLINLDLDNLTNGQLKKVFKKILVKGRIVNDKKEVFLCFQYNFLDIVEDDLYKDFEEQFILWKRVV